MSFLSLRNVILHMFKFSTHFVEEEIQSSEKSKHLMKITFCEYIFLVHSRKVSLWKETEKEL